MKTYVKDAEIYSCEGISDCESDSVSRELMLLSLIALIYPSPQHHSTLTSF